MSKIVDDNGFWKVNANPLSKVGVFPYLGKQISDKLEPNRIYMVYRPAEELFSKDAIDSFNENPVPLIENHEMIGKGFKPAEEKGLEGVVTNIRREGDRLVGDISIYSDRLKKKISEGKKDLSMGYFCNYELKEGDWQGHHYDAIQRDMRSNHIALVDRGRMGGDVRVYDSFSFDCAIAQDVLEGYILKQSASLGGKVALESLMFLPGSVWIKGARAAYSAYKLAGAASSAYKLAKFAGALNFFQKTVGKNAPKIAAAMVKGAKAAKASGKFQALPVWAKALNNVQRMTKAGRTINAASLAEKVAANKKVFTKGKLNFPFSATAAERIKAKRDISQLSKFLEKIDLSDTQTAAFMAEFEKKTPGFKESFKKFVEKGKKSVKAAGRFYNKVDEGIDTVLRKGLLLGQEAVTGVPIETRMANSAKAAQSIANTSTALKEGEALSKMREKIMPIVSRYEQTATIADTDKKVDKAIQLLNKQISRLKDKTGAQAQQYLSEIAKLNEYKVASTSFRSNAINVRFNVEKALGPKDFRKDAEALARATETSEGMKILREGLQAIRSGAIATGKGISASWNAVVNLSKFIAKNPYLFGTVAGTTAYQMYGNNTMAKRMYKAVLEGKETKSGTTGTAKKENKKEEDEPTASEANRSILQKCIIGSGILAATGSAYFWDAAKLILPRLKYRRLRDSWREMRGAGTAGGFAGFATPIIHYSLSGGAPGLINTAVNSVAGAAVGGYGTAAAYGMMKALGGSYKKAKKMSTAIKRSKKMAQMLGEPKAWITVKGRHIPIYEDSGVAIARSRGRPRKTGDSADDIQWITVHGQHIPIKKGTDVKKGIAEFFANKKSTKPRTTHNSMAYDLKHGKFNKNSFMNAKWDYNVVVPHKIMLKGKVIKPAGKPIDRLAASRFLKTQKSVDDVYRSLRSRSSKQAFLTHASEYARQCMLAACIKKSLPNLSPAEKSHWKDIYKDQLIYMRENRKNLKKIVTQDARKKRD